MRKVTDLKMKKYWYQIIGKHLHVKNYKSDKNSLLKHQLIGVEVSKLKEEQLINKTHLYPISLIFPGMKENK